MPFALLNLLLEAIEADRYPLSPRVELLRQILAKFGELGMPPELDREAAAPCASTTSPSTAARHA